MQENLQKVYFWSVFCIFRSRDPTSDSEAIRLLTAKQSNLQHSCFYEIDNALHDAIFVACIVFFFEVVFE